MSKCNAIVLKLIAVLTALIGLVAMIAAWDLMLLSNIYNSTVLVMEMGGVVLCLIGYFSWKHLKATSNGSKNCSLSTQN